MPKAWSPRTFATAKRLHDSLTVSITPFESSRAMWAGSASRMNDGSSAIPCLICSLSSRILSRSLPSDGGWPAPAKWVCTARWASAKRWRRASSSDPALASDGIGLLLLFILAGRNLRKNLHGSTSLHRFKIGNPSNLLVAEAPGKPRGDNTSEPVYAKSTELSSVLCDRSEN